MKKMTNKIISLVPSALTVVFALYGFYSLFTEIFVNIIPCGILLTAVIVLGIHVLRVPAPSQEQVEAIIGKDLHNETNGVDFDYVLKTVAHRGAGLDAPENSLIAFKLCNEKGCDCIEFDITLTSDGIPIVFHDKTLERMADSNLLVNETNWENLSNIDISVKHPYADRFTNTNIPTLDKTVEQLLASAQRMFIDIKDNNTKMVPVILVLFNKYPELVSRAVVTSVYPNIIYLVRRNNPKIVCSLAYRPHQLAYDSYKYPEGKGSKISNVWYRQYFLELLDILHSWALPRITYYLLGISIILLHKDAISAEAIVEWRKKGIRVMAWTVNSPTEKQHLARNLKITYLTDTLTGESTTHLPLS